MDNKTIFVRTSKGEEQVQSRTSSLSGDIKRALSMVDGISSFGEISKRSAPSMRANLAETFEELEKNGLIHDKSFAGKIPKTAMPSQMVVPIKMAIPRKNPAADKVDDELDFMSGYTASSQQAPASGGKDEKLRAEADEISKREIEAQKIKAQQEAEAILRKAEEDARLRLEAAERERKEAEISRLKAEQEAKRVRDELEAAKRKAEQEARLRFEAAEKERKEAEAARLKAQQEATQRQIELELAKRREELEAEARLQAQAQAAARKKAVEEAEQARIAAQAREAADKQAAQTSEPTAGKTGSFSFDDFQIDEFQQAPEPQKKQEPAQKARPEGAAPADAKKDAFAFDSFNVDEPVRPVEPRQDRRPGEAAKPAQPVDMVKSVERAVSPGASAAGRKPGMENIEKENRERENREREQLKREAQARIAEEARTKEMADAQAKVWAEAEQRALEAAKANAAQVAHRAEHPSETAPVKKPVPAARAPRKPFAWGKLRAFVFTLVTFLLVLAVGALFVVPYFLPMRDYMPKVQQMISDELHQPVHLGYMSGRILPTPRLDLGEIYIGDAKQFQAATAQINFDIMGVFDDNKPIDSVNFQKVKVRGVALTDSAAWLQKLAADSQYPVRRMTIGDGTLEADAFQLTGVEGELNFNSAGEFTVAKLSASSGKYTVVINAAPKDKLMAAITVRGGALPMLPNWTFDELDAKGEISGDALSISDFEAKILGGKLQGNARIDWHSGWHAEGALNAKQIVMNNFGKLLNGNVDGSAHFKMASKDFAGLTDSAEMEGSFTSTGGLLSGLDIIDTARGRSKENLPGGRTHYDQLNGHFAYTNNVYHFKQVKIDAGVLNANATFDINKQQLSGNMKVHLDLHDVTAVNLKLGGAIDNPTLVYAP